MVWMKGLMLTLRPLLLMFYLLLNLSGFIQQSHAESKLIREQTWSSNPLILSLIYMTYKNSASSGTTTALGVDWHKYFAPKPLGLALSSTAITKSVGEISLLNLGLGPLFRVFGQKEDQISYKVGPHELLKQTYKKSKYSLELEALLNSSFLFGESALSSYTGFSYALWFHWNNNSFPLSFCLRSSQVKKSNQSISTLGLSLGTSFEF
ncbi:MAG: hypothetical protein HQK50_08780 [Oligoflexia bacterium]|nr:hypothetical protein [Oligoflexia bacterium]MBF0365653.1 hypothetical protein [Oligoflexia bacterium]